MLSNLSKLLQHHHYLHPNGYWVTDYHLIPHLRVLATTTNGTSGIGRYRGTKVYWSLNHRTSVFEVETC